jgi:hypothetical protein
MSRPSNVMRPALDGSRPATDLSTVDLPAPLVPRSAISSLRSTPRSTPNSTCSVPYDASMPSQVSKWVPRRSRRTLPTLSPGPAASRWIAAV